jgi:hypothetical protein
MTNEQALNHVLQNLPLRQTPASFEARVLQQLEQRWNRDWWRRGFAHWPAAARVAFVSLCISLVSATLMDTLWSTLGADALHRAFGRALSWTYLAVGAVASATDLWTRVASALPENWRFTIVAVAAVLYAALFGLGAIAYRTLFLSPSPRQVIR